MPILHTHFSLEPDRTAGESPINRQEPPLVLRLERLTIGSLSQATFLRRHLPAIEKILLQT